MDEYSLVTKFRTLFNVAQFPVTKFRTLLIITHFQLLNLEQVL